MKLTVYRLFTGYRYLAIKHPGLVVFNYVLPGVFTLIASGLVITIDPVFLGQTGLIRDLTDFILILPGFFIAALAAIATFNRPGLDQTMPEPAPTIGTYVNGLYTHHKLTRRRFLALLFVYLCATSILLTLIGITAQHLAPPILERIAPPTSQIFKSCFLVFYFFIFAQLFVNMLLGLYYLGERLLLPD